mgnify:CR=1 FL=1
MTSLETTLLDPHVREVMTKAENTPHGATIFWKWTCGGCGQRVASDEENTLHTSYKHTDPECRYETATVDGDLGFALLIMRERV